MKAKIRMFHLKVADWVGPKVRKDFHHGDYLLPLTNTFRYFKFFKFLAYKMFKIISSWKLLKQV